MMCSADLRKRAADLATVGRARQDFRPSGHGIAASALADLHAEAGNIFGGLCYAETLHRV